MYTKTGSCITRVQNAQSIPVPDLHFSSCVRYAQTIPSAHHVGSYQSILSTYAKSLEIIRRVQLLNWATCGHLGQTSLAFWHSLQNFCRPVYLILTFTLTIILFCQKALFKIVQISWRHNLLQPTDIEFECSLLCFS